MPTACSAGTYVGSAGSTSAASCVACAVGFVSNAAATVCTACPVNQYAAQTGMSACFYCPSGSTTISLTGQSTCSCNAGYLQAGSGFTLLCTLCPVNTYASAVRAVSCVACPSGSSTNTMTGQTVCSCMAGYQTTGAGPVCAICAAGSYSAASGSSTCTTTNPGYFAATGASGAAICVAGTYAALAGMSACLAAPQGSYALAGSTALVACARNYYAQLASSSACMACPTNSFSWVMAATCTCNSGYAQSGFGAALACTQCTANQYTVLPTLYTVSAVGLNAVGTLAPLAGGIYDAFGNNLYGLYRSYMLIRILRATGAVVFTNNYDVYGSSANAGTLAADLAASTSAYIIILYTWDEVCYFLSSYYYYYIIIIIGIVELKKYANAVATAIGEFMHCNYGLTPNQTIFK